MGGAVHQEQRGLQLVSDFDYDREPVLDPPYTAEDCAKWRSSLETPGRSPTG